MNKRVTLLVSMLGAAGCAHAQTWDINGFVSVGGGSTLDDDQSYYDLDDSFDLEQSTKFGLQVDLELSDKWSATVQGVVRGSDDWEPELEWAYLTYEINSSWKVRAGRLRQPFYMISDYLEVGYAYPWLRPPKEVYGRLPISWFEGIDVIYTTSVGDWDLQAQAYHAKTDQVLDFSGQSADTDLDQTGLALTFSNDWLTFRASYHYSDTNIYVASLDPLFGALQQVGAGLVQTGTQFGILPLVDAGNGVIGIPDDMAIIDKSASFVEAGFIVDPGENWFVRGEWAGVNYDRSIIPESAGYYLTGGLRHRDFTYLLTYANDTTDPRTGFSDPLVTASAIISPLDPVTGATLDALAAAVESATFPPADINSWTLGMRWDFRDKMALKAEYVHSDDGVSSVGALTLGVDMVF